jgi:GT2 family glycosyltransferase
MIIRREALREVGLLDERFFMYWEDTDLCRRMWNNGWRVIYTKISSVTHRIGGSSKSRPLKSLVEFHKSCYKLFCKYSNQPIEILAPFVVFALGSKLGMMIAIHMIDRLSNPRKSINHFTDK